MSFAGSGEGSGTARFDDVREDFTEVFAEAPTASANPLSDKPAANVNAHAFVATFLKCLDIIPSSGMAAETSPDAP
jgi:hypothetical protein